MTRGHTPRVAAWPSDDRRWIHPVFWMKIQRIESFKSVLAAAHQAAPREAGDPHQSRAEQQHARRLGDVDVGITLGGGRKTGDWSRRGRRALGMNRRRSNGVGLATCKGRRRSDEANTSNTDNGSETNEQRTRIHLWTRDSPGPPGVPYPKARSIPSMQLGCMTRRVARISHDCGAFRTQRDQLGG
jgi:hypothetical protein